MTELKTQVLSILGGRLRDILGGLSAEDWRRAEEIRLRRGGPLTLVCGGTDVFVDSGGRECEQGAAYQVTPEDIMRTLQLLSQSSVYALEEELRRGYVTAPGGHRVGLAGRVVLEGGAIRTMKSISGLNVRLARQVTGAADPILPFILQGGGPHHVLLASRPRGGKTTVLRDLVRQLSDGVPRLKCRGRRVVVVDERSEIAACRDGEPQLAVGCRTDVLDACPKAEGIVMALRGLSPDIIATDEIGRPEDAAAIAEVLNAGVKVLATAHADRRSDLFKRPVLKELLAEGTFGRVVFLGQRGSLESVYDGEGRPLFVRCRAWTAAGRG
ncbi:MAG: stage III sporulation protein AA [Bacillota bacterium]